MPQKGTIVNLPTNLKFLNNILLSGALPIDNDDDNPNTNQGNGQQQSMIALAHFDFPQMSQK